MAAAFAATPAVARQEAPSVRAAPTAAVQATDVPRPKRGHGRGDPLEGFNRAMWSVHVTLDRLFFRPVAKAYEKVVPKFLRKGLRHAFSNLQEPIVFANDVLQLRPKRALKTFGRFAINSTVGVGGLLDVAKGENRGLEHRDNGFGNTLGRYGVGPGPYIFLPLVGPSTLRDFAGGQADGAALRYGIGTPFDRAAFTIPRGAITGLDFRAEADGAYTALIGGAVDPYATLRSAYLQDRAGTVAALRRGRVTQGADPLDDPLADPAGVSGTVVAAPAGSPLDDPLADPAPPPDLPMPAATP